MRLADEQGTSTSIGREKQTNRALQTNEREFVEESASVSTPKPPTTERVVALNRGPWVAARPPLAELDGPGAAVVLDVRPVERFAADHVPGAISVALDGGSFATRAAFVLDPAEQFEVHAGSKREAREAARLLTAVGLHEVVGRFRSDGEVRDDGHRHRGRLRAPARGRRPPGARRMRGERARGAPAGCPARLEILPWVAAMIAPPASLDPGRPVDPICASGARATLAASLLARQGFDARPVVGGGVADLPVSCRKAPCCPRSSAVLPRDPRGALLGVEQLDLLDVEGDLVGWHVGVALGERAVARVELLGAV